ncbi:MAG: ORF6N domain-containing protein [Verrucomicrobia subdivision 3 bacterium]|nr:ORF6N domain-containing protein [Limisphaerales bacterium]
MDNDLQQLRAAQIGLLIHVVRNQRVMLDSDLAALYGVSTKQLAQQFRRNRERFPADFAFQLTRGEYASIRSQNATASERGGRRYLPFVFTEHGAIMLATVLNSSLAIEASVRVVRAFVHLREMSASNKELAVKLAELERRLGAHDGAIRTLFDAIKQLVEGPAEEKQRREIGFHMREEARKYRVRNGA